MGTYCDINIDTHCQVNIGTSTKMWVPTVPQSRGAVWISSIKVSRSICSSPGVCLFSLSTSQCIVVKIAQQEKYSNYMIKVYLFIHLSAFTSIEFNKIFSGCQHNQVISVKGRFRDCVFIISEPR